MRSAYSPRLTWPVLACIVACSSGGDIIRSNEPEPMVPHTPRAADAFVSSLGVAIAPNGDEPTFEASVIAPLVELGIRHARAFAPLPDAAGEAALQNLSRAGAAGVRTQLIFEPRFGVLPEHVAPISAAMGDALSAIEGANDFDAYDIDLTASDVRAQTTELRGAINAAGIADRVALVQALDETNEPLGDLSSVLDFGNFERPRAGLPAPSLSEQKASARATSGNRPLMATECGYSTLSAAANGIPEPVAAKYLPRLVLGHFAEGIARTFFADLWDSSETADANEPHLFEGLVRFDGTRKPAFEALRRLISLLGDPGAPSATEPVEYRLLDRPPALRELLLQKRDGTSYLVLWLEVESYDTSTRRELAVPAADVTLELPAPVQQLRVYLPVEQSAPVQELEQANQVVLHVPDHPLIVELPPAR